ncbi:hypothetical protein [Hyphomicrobium sp.]|jgi:hypothetical protein|uniref:hypothetical protein n=1 Tax=Hyphomicrobium sp. TaxID=82 RepID=UPI002CE9C813|nr:hypothetical protein [Hyphomicrobium sp.]HVZ05964.1 hypothetical protein [Hyphomicrobium sp.]
MKKSISAFIVTSAALLVLVSPAFAKTTASLHHHYVHKAHVAKHHMHRRHSAHLRHGYWRPGPPYGYRFGFSTYAGDPFYSDDYFDGRHCYYLHRRDFCRGPKSLDWLRW